MAGGEDDATLDFNRLNAAFPPPHRVSAAVEDGVVVFRIGRVAETALCASNFDALGRLCLLTSADRRLVRIDLADCRIVSSIELTLVGAIVHRARHQALNVAIHGANRFVANALRMLGLDKVCTIAG